MGYLLAVFGVSLILVSRYIFMAQGALRDTSETSFFDSEQEVLNPL